MKIKVEKTIKVEEEIEIEFPTYFETSDTLDMGGHYTVMTRFRNATSYTEVRRESWPHGIEYSFSNMRCLRDKVGEYLSCDVATEDEFTAFCMEAVGGLSEIVLEKP